MARKTYASFTLAGSTVKSLRSIATALATLASGKNPDATNYTLPISGVVATPTPIASGTGDAQGVAAATNLRLLGYSCREAAGTPAAAGVTLRNGTANTDPIIGFETLAASGEAVRWFGPNGIACPAGVFVDRTAGNTEIVLYTAAIE